MTDTSRLPSITEDSDWLALLAALERDGELPGWVSDYSRAAFAFAGFLDPERPDQLSEYGLAEARRWQEIKDEVARTQRSWRWDF
jgi:hypothetical protein